MIRSVEVSTSLRATAEEVRAVLTDGPGRVLGPRDRPRDRTGGSQQRSFETTLGLEVGSGGHLEQQVRVEVGPARPAGRGVRVPLSWRAIGWERLFPTFEGILAADPEGSGSQIHLRGAYTVPLGPLGGFGDGIAGRRLARQSLSTFLGQAAARIDEEVGRRRNAPPPEPAQYRIAVREVGSENFVG